MKAARAGSSTSKRLLRIATALTIVGTIEAEGQVPKTPAQVPAFTGAAWRVTDSATSEEPSMQAQRYTAAAPVEAVVKFYVQRLGAKPEREGEEPEAGPLALGAATPVSYGTILYDLTKPDTLREGQESEGRVVAIIPAARKRATLTKARPPYEPDHWVSEAHFNWYARQGNGAVSVFGLSVIDRGIPPDWNSYASRTEVSLEVQTWPCSGDLKPDSPELGQLCGQVPERRAGAAGITPPTAQPPRALVYPGATFDAQTSAGMSSGGDAFFVYVTTDPAARVAAFYEAKTGKKAQKVEDGSFALFLSGRPLPDLTIQSNLAGPFAGKTVITIAQLKF